MHAHAHTHTQVHTHKHTQQIFCCMQSAAPKSLINIFQFVQRGPFEHAQLTADVNNNLGLFAVLQISFSSLTGMHHSGYGQAVIQPPHE